MSCGPNDGGVKRGDREDTGDNEARPRDGVSEGGSGVPGGAGGASGHPTGATDSLAESTSGVSIASEDVVQRDGGIDDLRVSGVEPGLGMTNTKRLRAEDWAANTGPTQNPESEKAEIEAPMMEPPRRSPRRKA